MKKILALTLITVFLFFTSNAMADWEQTFGGPIPDIATDVQQTRDGGYVAVGYTGNTYSADAWLIKTDADGNGSIKSLGSSRFALSVQQTDDDGYIIAGQTTDSEDAWLMKVDADGNPGWEKTFGGSSMDRASSAQQTNDGGYIVAGWTNSYGAGQDDGWLIKTDANGIVEDDWPKTFGGPGGDEFYKVQQTPDDGYIIVGVTKSFGAGNWDGWLIKTDADGNEDWSETFGWASEDWTVSLDQTLDGGYIIAGWTSWYGAGHNDVWLIKTDADGNAEWDKTFGGPNYDRANSVQQTADGGYIIAGWNSSYGAGSDDVWLIKTDSNGNKLWDKTFGGPNLDRANSVQQTTDGGYIIAGETSSYGAGSNDAWLIKVPPDMDDDGVPNDIDNCPSIPNPEEDWKDINGVEHSDEQRDYDLDGVGDACDYCLEEDATGFDADVDGCVDTPSGLIDIINALPPDVLSDQTKNSLVSKVEAAQKSIDKEKDQVAINQLNAFINEIEAQRGKKISEEAADMLIQYALNIISQIEAG